MNFSFSTLTSRFAQYAGALDQQTWLLICAGGMIVGYFCLRGFGSRDNY
ncbi:MAG: hypothetical protein MI757_16085 [Pirellulales bacterium]|nr:hypothetical protein [Pirellulales bacterium]